MEWLNYHHLMYFWVVARHGSIAGASRELGLAHHTIGGQVHELEAILGERLLERKGRQLVLTGTGRIAFGYAEEIFKLGSDFRVALHGVRPRQPITLTVGVSYVLPKSIVRKMLQPVSALKQPVRLLIREVRAAVELGEIGLQAFDVLLTDTQAPVGGERAFSHLLGECGTAFLATPSLAVGLRRGFPSSLEGMPVLLPGNNGVLRRSLEQWLDGLSLRPTAVAEAEDSSLLKVFAAAGLGVVPVPDVVERDVRTRYGLSLIGRAPEVRQQFYAISIERRIKHPAVVAICAAARNEIFG